MEESIVSQQIINQQRVEIIERYPVLWSKLIEEWSQPGMEDRAWLMYSASYLFRTSGIRWAMDPVRLASRLPGASEPDVAHDFKDLSFVLLTHRHADHLDLDLINSIRDSSIIWVVPRAILPLIRKYTYLPEKQIVVPKMNQPLEFHGIRVTPFDGLHWERIEPRESERSHTYWRGVPAVGYLVEFSGKRWLLPGDTRTYDARRLPSFGPVNGLFAHVWLGRGSAMLGEAPLLGAFSRYCLALQPQRIILTHLNEYGREAEDYWDEGHAISICSAVQAISPGISVIPAFLGDAVSL